MIDPNNFAPSRLRVSELLEQHFDIAFAAPDGIKKLRELILTLAMQGKLVEQDPNDPPASELLKEIEKAKASREGAKTRRKDKELPPIKPEEVTYELPQGWEWVRVWDVAQLITSGSRDWAKYCSDSGAIFVTMGNLSRGNYQLRMDTIRYVAPPSKGEGSRTKLEENDLLISITGDVGNLGLIPANFGEAYINQHTCLLRFMDSCRNRYFPELMRSPLAKEQFDAPQRGIKNSFRLGDVGEMIIPLPPLPEQHRIVARIDQLMARCDELEKLRKEREEKRLAVHAAAISQLLDSNFASSRLRVNQDSSNLRSFVPSCETGGAFDFLAQHFGELYTVKENVAELRKAILQLAVMGRLVPQDPNDPPASELLKEIEKEKASREGAKTRRKEKKLPPIKPEEVPYELPQGWEWVRLGDISLSSDSGWSPQCLPQQRTNGQWGVLKVSAVSWGKFNPDENKALPSDKDPRPEYEVQSGNFLLSRANTDELVARSVIVEETPEKLMMSDKIVRFELSQHINKHFINIANGTDFSRTYYIANASGTSSSMKNVSRKVMEELPIPLPPLPEQHRIVSRIDQLMALCDALEQRIDAATGKQTELLDAVMALSG
jgi:type I restriction enzyme S subunit